jgi:hypothetical protein
LAGGGGGDEESGNRSGGAGFGGAGGNTIKPGEPLKDASGKVVPPDFEAPKFDFIVQFAWKSVELGGVPATSVVVAPASGGNSGMDGEDGMDQ